MFWLEHRPEIAWSIWSGILPWNTLDSLGHIHEVLAGNFYREQTESVPEQTWSSAGLLDAAVRGLLGIEINGARNSIAFHPHLPAEWDKVSIDNLRLPHSTLGFTMTQDINGINLEIANDGAPATLSFAPQIPLGARLSSARFAGHAIEATVKRFAQDEHEKVEIQAPSGISHCHLGFAGGVSLILPTLAPQIGDPSTGMKMTHLQLQNLELSIDMDISPSGNNIFRIRTPWKVAGAKGATIQSLSNEEYEVEVHKASDAEKGSGYSGAHIEISFVAPR